jgi:NAD(P)-dependent dehydrogenase (short-subunit alcohol dehydrogenase family)
VSQPVTLVTGASRGIGLAIAEALTAGGHHVVGMARRRPERFAGTFHAVDLADQKATADALAEVTGRHRILRLVNNAGIARMANLDGTVLADFEAMMAVNVRAALQCIEAVVPAMREARFGRIVNIGSRASLGKQGRVVYGASKAAVTGLTRSAALELAKDGITVNCIAPGPIETDMIHQNYPPGSDARARLIAEVPAARFGRPEEIAAAAQYFLAEAAGFTTGQVLYVCGGLSVGPAPI